MTLPSPPNHHIRVPRRQGVHVGQTEIAGTVTPIGILVLPLHNGEGGVDIAHIIPVGDAVKMEEQGIQLGPQVETTNFIPGERRQNCARLVHMAHVTGKGGHIVGGVGELQDSGLDDLSGGLWGQSGWWCSGLGG